MREGRRYRGASAQLVHDLDDAIVAEVDDGAMAVDDRRSISRPIGHWKGGDVAGKRLTYAQLTGKQVDSLHHSAAETRTEEEPF